MKAIIVLSILYAFGIGFFVGNFSGYIVCKEKKEINDFESPAEFLCFLLISPVLAIFWGITLFFKGIKGLEEKR